MLLPLYVLEQSAGAPFAAVLIGLRGIGMILFDIPVGILLARLGDKPVLLGGLAAVERVDGGREVEADLQRVLHALVLEEVLALGELVGVSTRQA